MREAELPIEQRLLQLLHHLGIKHAHFAGRTPRDWSGLAKVAPEAFYSLTLMGPASIDPASVRNLASRLLVISGDNGLSAERVQRSVTNIPGARLVRLPNYSFLGWSDAVADRTGEVGSAMLDFLATKGSAGGEPEFSNIPTEGEVAGITYLIRGAGPPLVLLPLFLAPSQWEPLIATLSEKYCTITLGGIELGAVAILESRGRAAGYLQMVRTVIDETELRPGENVLEIGCGTGVLDRWLARNTSGHNPITALDINRYLLREAERLARKECLQDEIEFREGRAEALPFSDNCFDLTLSVTVIEEVDAGNLLAEMVRVTKPGGRVAVIARSVDIPFLMNVPLSPTLKAKVEAPGMNFANIEEKGCGDATLYGRFYQAGLTRVRKMPHFATFDDSAPTIIQFIETSLLSKLSADEAQEWKTARAKAEAVGTFFIGWPHHCAVGTKPGIDHA